MSGSGSRVEGGPDRRPAGPSDDDIRAQLRRIENSREFDAPGRVRAFLRYVVEEALAGRSDRIKAYAIAVEVFGRDADFDPASDPVVRTEAGRLRRALERYYLMAGRADPVVIDVPKGGYLPTFASKEQEPPAETAPQDPVVPSSPPPGDGPAAPPRRWLPWTVAAITVSLAGLLAIGLWSGGTSAFGLWPDPPVDATVPHRPLLVVRPFVSLGGDADAGPYAASLTDEVLSQLARFRELRVGREISAALPATAGASADRANAGVRYVLEGTVKAAGDGLRVNARVLDGETAVVLGASIYEADLTAGDTVSIVVDVAGQVAASVAQPYGIIFHADQRRWLGNIPSDLAAYQCTQRFYRYRAALSAEEHAAVRGCLERAIALYPGYATAWAMLSYLHLDEDRFEFNRRAGEPTAIERALEAARHAVRLDPYNVRALQALMTALFFSGEPSDALRIGEQALALNPNDTELLGELGSRMAQAGDWVRGSALLERALAMNPGNSGYYAGMLALAAFVQRDTPRAVTLIRQADLRKFPLYHVVAALIHADAGLEEAAEFRARFLEMRPRFFDDLDGELDKRNFGPEDRQFLTEAARRAGFPVRYGPAGERPGGGPSTSEKPFSINTLRPRARRRCSRGTNVAYCNLLPGPAPPH